MDKVKDIGLKDYKFTFWVIGLCAFLYWLLTSVYHNNINFFIVASLLWSITFDRYKAKKQSFNKEGQGLYRKVVWYQRLHYFLLFILIFGAILQIIKRDHLIPASWVIDHKVEDSDILIALGVKKVSWVDNDSFITQATVDRPINNVNLIKWTVSGKTLRQISYDDINEKLYISGFCYDFVSKNFAFYAIRSSTLGKKNRGEIYGKSLNDWGFMENTVNYRITDFDCRIIERDPSRKDKGKRPITLLREEDGYLEGWNRINYNLIQNDEVVLEGIQATEYLTPRTVEYLPFINAYNVHKPTVKWEKMHPYNEPGYLSQEDYNKRLFSDEACFRNTLIFAAIPKVEYDCIPGSKFTSLGKPDGILRTQKALLVRFRYKGLFVYKYGYLFPIAKGYSGYAGVSPDGCKVAFTLASHPTGDLWKMEHRDHLLRLNPVKIVDFCINDKIRS